MMLPENRFWRFALLLLLVAIITGAGVIAHGWVLELTAGK